MSLSLTFTGMKYILAFLRMCTQLITLMHIYTGAHITWQGTAHTHTHTHIYTHLSPTHAHAFKATNGPMKALKSERSTYA